MITRRRSIASNSEQNSVEKDAEKRDFPDSEEEKKKKKQRRLLIATVNMVIQMRSLYLRDHEQDKGSPLTLIERGKTDSIE